MITTERLMIKEALPSEIDMIIDIESHPLNKDYLWVGTPEEHQDTGWSKIYGKESFFRL